jgi:hypothetical protein
MLDNKRSEPASCPYATHLEATVASAIYSGMIWPDSSILELGCGDYSTPTLASITRAQGRLLNVITSDATWASRYKYLLGPNFSLKIINYVDWPRVEFGGQYGMVLVDNEQIVFERLKLVRRLRGVANTVVLHDADVVERAGRSWHSIKRLFKNVYIHRQRRPHTAIMSDCVNPQDWFDYAHVEAHK